MLFQIITIANKINISSFMRRYETNLSLNHVKLNHFGNGVNLKNLDKTRQTIACLERTFKVARTVDNFFLWTDLIMIC